MKYLDINQIKEIIPHRHPFLLLDYIEDYEPGQYAVGYKCVSYREEFFAGHFPQEPVMPGVLTVEALAQAGAVAILSMEENRIIKQQGPVGVGEAIASVDGKTVVSAELTFMIG